MGLKAPAAEAPLLKLIDSLSEPVRSAAWEVARHFELRALVAKAAADLLDLAVPVARRAVAIRALRGGPFGQASAVAKKALEDGHVEVAALDVAARTRGLEQGDRAKVVEAYRDVLKLNGVADRGKAWFDENCAKCHMPRKQGGRVGPDLSGINNKTKDELLTSILDPSYAIEPRFTHYIVTTRDGHVHDGVLARETPALITLRGGTEDGDETVLRANIQEIRTSSISLMLMPEELEKSIDRQGLADVTAYLRGGL